MKKVLFILPLLAILFAACSQKSKLTGKLSDSENDGKQVFILAMSDFDSPFLPIDSTVVKNGSFEFQLNDALPQGVAYVVIKDANGNIANGIPFVYEKGNIDINIDSVTRVSGTVLNDKSQVFWDQLNGVSNKAQAIGEKLGATQDEKEREQLLENLMGVNKEASGVIFKFVKENITNKVGEFYLIHFIQAFDDTQINELLDSASPEFSSKMKELLGGEMENDTSDFVGKEYIDLTGETPEGKMISLSTYVKANKVVLLDFWASWCGPCRVEMPSVVKAYEKYKSKGFEIVGVSLDEDKESWTKGLKDLKMTWPQMSDLKGWDSDLGAVYGVKSIPFTLLIDQEGKIIGQNLRGQQLEDKLEQLLK